MNGFTELQPFFQIMRISPITPTKTTSSCFRISLLDGMHKNETLLPCKYSGHVVSGDLQLGSLIILNKVACIVLQHSMQSHNFYPLPCIYMSLFYSIFLSLINSEKEKGLPPFSFSICLDMTIRVIELEVVKCTSPLVRNPLPLQNSSSSSTKFTSLNIHVSL